MVSLGAFNEGWVAVCAGPLLKGSLPEDTASHEWECCQLGVKWELVTAEMGRMCWGKGPAKCSPSPREREEDALRRVQQRSSEGIVLFSSDTVSCCSIQLLAAAGCRGREGGWWLGAVAGGLGVAASLGPAGAGGCPREGVVHVQETQ